MTDLYDVYSYDRENDVTSRTVRAHASHGAEEAATAIRTNGFEAQVVPTGTEPNFAADAADSDDLSKLKVADLRQMADDLGLDHDGLNKADLVELLEGATASAE